MLGGAGIIDGSEMTLRQQQRLADRRLRAEPAGVDRLGEQHRLVGVQKPGTLLGGDGS
jgi:hypothetical protein